MVLLKCGKMPAHKGVERYALPRCTILVIGDCETLNLINPGRKYSPESMEADAQLSWVRSENNSPVRSRGSFRILTAIEFGFMDSRGHARSADSIDRG